MTELMVSPETFTRLTKVANERKSTIEILAEQVIRQFLELEAQEKMAHEIKAFRAMHPELLIQYPKHYVAIYQGQVVDHDTERLSLFLRIDERYPYEVVLIRQVLPDVDPVYTIHSTRFARDEQSLQL